MSRKKNDEKKPLGRQSWAKGDKLTFLEGHKDDFLSCVGTDDIGKFYTRITRSFLQTFGYENVFDETARLPPDTQLVVGDADQHLKTFKDLRNVSIS
ncbi:hypothetical protein HGRIS_000543 [Hohenbuehelia grisea]|uniref:Uncharacterized protein n=1 Tax=Hohenbuehelia grisea TaxID=104357 RepID=A0ABR3JS99_9AGAR